MSNHDGHRREADRITRDSLYSFLEESTDSATAEKLIRPLMQKFAVIPKGSIEFHDSEDWTAAYYNGLLVQVGDSYHADEWLQELSGVAHNCDEPAPFMQGGNSYSDVAQTLTEVEAYKERQDEVEREKEIAEKQARIRALSEELRQLRS